MLTLVTTVDGFSKDLLDQVSDAVMALDKDFRIVYCNSAAEKMFELTAEGGLGKQLSELHSFRYPGASQDKVLLSLQEQKKWKGEMVFTNQYGKDIHILSSVNEYYGKDGGHLGYIGVSTDITELKLSSQELEQTLAHNKQMLDGISEGIILHNREGVVVSCNKNAEYILEMDKQTLETFFLPPITWRVYNRNLTETPLMEHPVYKAFQLGKTLKNQVLGIEINDRIKWLSINVSPVKDPGNKNPITAASSFRDISEQIELENKANAADVMFKSFMNNTPSLNWITAEDGTIVFFNRKYLRDFKFDTSAIGKNIRDLFPEAAAEEFRQNNLEVLKQNRTIIAVEKVPYPKGKIRSFLVMKFPLKLGDNTIAIGGTGMDITEQLEMEEVLRSQEILNQKKITRASIEAQEKERAAIGKQLHESVSQVLSSTKLYIDMVLKSKVMNEELLQKSATYLNDAISEIRFLSSALTPQTMKDIGLNASIRELAEPLILSGKLKMELLLEEEVEQAMNPDSRLTVLRIIQEQLNNILRHSQASNCSIVLQLKRERISLVIKDDGIGFNPEEGNNSGLNNIHYRVDSYRGDFHIDSAPGNGCTLRVSLPTSS